MRNYYFLIFLLLLAGCSNKAGSMPADDDAGSFRELTEDPVISTDLSEDQKIAVCKAGQAAATGAPVETMKAVPQSDGLVRISYVRDDGKAFAYDCAIEGNRIRQRMIDERGRGTGPGVWSGRGSNETFEIKGNEIIVSTVFFDGSTDLDSFDF